MNQVDAEGIRVDLERDGKIVAHLTPAKPHSPLTVKGLNAFLKNLPSLGDDAEEFAKDVKAIRAEQNSFVS